MQCATKICLSKQQEGRTLAEQRLEKDRSSICVRGGINASKKRGKMWADLGGYWSKDREGSRSCEIIAR